MGRRPYLSRFECGHAGCAEIANYEAHTRADQTKLYQRYGNGKWRCSRHSQPLEVLGADNPCTTHEVVCSEHFSSGRSIGLYWGEGGGASGFNYGPGFRAFAKDFPIGTRLRVTAEIILPADYGVSDGALGRQGNLPPPEPLLPPQEQSR